MRRERRLSVTNPSPTASTRAMIRASLCGMVRSLDPKTQTWTAESTSSRSTVAKTTPESSLRCASPQRSISPQSTNLMVLLSPRSSPSLPSGTGRPPWKKSSSVSSKRWSPTRKLPSLLTATCTEHFEANKMIQVIRWGYAETTSHLYRYYPIPHWRSPPSGLVCVGGADPREHRICNSGTHLFELSAYES